MEDTELYVIILSNLVNWQVCPSCVHHFLLSPGNTSIVSWVFGIVVFKYTTTLAINFKYKFIVISGKYVKSHL